MKRQPMSPGIRYNVAQWRVELAAWRVPAVKLARPWLTIPTK